MRLKTKKDVAQLRVSGRILAETLKLIAKECKPGVSLEYLDGLAHDYIKRKGAKPAFLGYKPAWADEVYPAAICTSLNEQIVHGIPSEYAVRDGDVIKLDLGVNYKGYFTDAAVTVAVGKVPARATRMIAATNGTRIRPIIQEAKKALSRDLSRKTVRKLTGALRRNFRS